MKINYISDLHFDYKELSEINKFFKLFKKGQLYVIAGDLFNDFNKSLVLIQKLDKMGIKGYWVLGNHEFFHFTEPGNVDPTWKDNGLFDNSMFYVRKDEEYDAYLKYVYELTKNFKNFKLLRTGHVENLDKKWKIIGDTCWTNFKGLDDPKKYEWNHLTNWKWCLNQNKKFISFMNKTIKNNKNVLVVTHHALYLPSKAQLLTSRFAEKKDKEVLYWWSDENLDGINNAKDKNVVFIHGHTHSPSFHKNHYTNGIGRKKDCIEMKMKTLNLK